MKDHIVQEVREARAAVAADFDFDLHKFFAWAKAHTAAERNARQWLPTGPKKTRTTTGAVPLARAVRKRRAETVRRVSVGAADHVPFAQVTNLARTMEKLKAAGLWLVGTSDHAASKSIYELDLKGPLALVLGAEEKGMRRLTEENCDFLARIPMAGKVECLNVSVATGVCLFEAVRQRRVSDE